MLPPERITAVETGACPHTAIRDDISANLEAVEDLEDAVGPLDLVLVESGGDNLTATFSKGLVDAQIFVIDVAGGDDIPRKGGPGVTTADLLVVNKTDLAPYVGSDLARMAADAKAQRAELPVVFQSLRSEPGVADVAAWVRAQLAAWAAGSAEQLRGAVRRDDRRPGRRPGRDGPARAGERRAAGAAAHPRERGRGAGHAGRGDERTARRRPLHRAGPGGGGCAAVRRLGRRHHRPAGQYQGEARYDVRLDVADQAELHWLPEQLISAQGSDLYVTTRIELAATARLVLREEQVLGRVGEEPGRLTSRLTVRVAGQAVLDQELACGPGAPGGWDGPAVLAGHRAVGQLIVVRPEFAAEPVPARALGEGASVVPLAGPAALVTAVAPDALRLRRLLDEALASLVRM
ncbi:Urease accessory protein UreG [Streptomyces violarus]